MSTHLFARRLQQFVIARKPIIILGLLFFVFGFVTWLGSVLIPYLKIACQLNNLESYLVAFAFYISYMVMALPAAWLLKYTGFKKGMPLGLTIMAIGVFIFIPAAQYRGYPIFLTGLFVQGAGLSILQTAANPYVTILGPRETAASRMSIMGICNNIAGIAAPLILGPIILDNADTLQKKMLLMNTAQQNATLDALARRVIMPYGIMAAVLLAVALFIYRSGLPEIDNQEEEEVYTGANTHSTSIFHFPHLLMGAFTLFLYVGVEVIAGDTIINYGAFQGISLATARFFTSCTLTAMLTGYLLGILCIPRFFSQEQALKGSALLGIAFVLAAIFTHGYLSVLFIALLGLSNALMWPAIWPLAIAGLGRFTKTGSSLLIMAIGGGAIMPLLYGRLADAFNLQRAYWIVVPCYAMIWYYAVKGHHMRRRNRVTL